MSERPIQENLSALFNTLNTNISALREEVSVLAVEIRKVNILEERDSTRREALERAFNEIKLIDCRLDKHEKLAAEEHKDIDKWRNSIAGACIVISIMWTIFGAYAMDSLKTASASMALMSTKLELHIQEDKIKTHEDVRAIHKGLDK